MRIYKVLSALLSYPTVELQAAAAELQAVITEANGLPAAARSGLRSLVDEISRGDLYELQENYVALFDRGRRLSLHLFEHVHGESRDRGQAMVDLISAYRTHGLELAARELPDYLPLFCEFLAQIPEPEALDLLRDALPIIELLGARLHVRSSSYASVFDALLAIGGQAVDEAAARRRVAGEGPDETIAQMDRIWEEEAVSFLGAHNDSCQRAVPIERPLRPMARPRCS